MWGTYRKYVSMSLFLWLAIMAKQDYYGSSPSARGDIMRLILKQAHDNIYEAINPLKILWLETDAHGCTVIVELVGENPPTWRKTAVRESAEEVQAQAQSVVRKMHAAGLFQKKAPSPETSTK